MVDQLFKRLAALHDILQLDPGIAVVVEALDIPAPFQVLHVQIRIDGLVEPIDHSGEIASLIITKPRRSNR